MAHPDLAPTVGVQHAREFPQRAGRASDANRTAPHLSEPARVPVQARPIGAPLATTIVLFATVAALLWFIAAT